MRKLTSIKQALAKCTNYGRHLVNTIQHKLENESNAIKALHKWQYSRLHLTPKFMCAVYVPCQISAFIGMFHCPSGARNRRKIVIFSQMSSLGLHAQI